jgi:hypothetical protein
VTTRSTIAVFVVCFCGAGCFPYSGDPQGGGKSASNEASSSSQQTTHSKDYFQQLIGDGSEDAPRGGSAPSPSGGGSEGSSDDTFADQAMKLKETVSSWDFGTGIEVQFQNEKSGQKLDLVYGDPQAPELKRDVKMWAIDAIAKANGKAMARFIVLTKSFSPGRYEAGPKNTDLIVISVLGGNLEINSDEAMSSLNPGGAIELAFRPAQKKGDVEGLFRGKLASKDGSTFLHVESGYMYVNR